MSRLAHTKLLWDGRLSSSPTSRTKKGVESRFIVGRIIDVFSRRWPSLGWRPHLSSRSTKFATLFQTFSHVTSTSIHVNQGNFSSHLETIWIVIVGPLYTTTMIIEYWIQVPSIKPSPLRRLKFVLVHVSLLSIPFFLLFSLYLLHLSNQSAPHARVPLARWWGGEQRQNRLCCRHCCCCGFRLEIGFN